MSELPLIEPQVLISKSNPIAQGGYRLVFDYPQRSGLIIKVQRVNLDQETVRLARVRFYRDMYREQREYYKAVRPYNGLPNYLVGYYGYVNTDMGPGIVYEKAVDADGRLAPTLKELAESDGLVGQVEEDLRCFYRTILLGPVICGDLFPNNIVYHAGATGESRFSVVDGLGDRGALPWNNLFPLLNRYRRWHRLKRIMRSLGMGHCV